MSLARAGRLRSALTSIISALFLNGTGMDSRRGRWFLRCTAPALLVLLSSGLLWAGSPATTFNGVVTALSTSGITLAGPNDVAVDSLGNVYIADASNNQIVEVTADGVASVLTFTGLSPALSAPQAVAVDGSGNLYIADGGNSRVVELAGGVASVVAMGSVTLSYPDGVAVDASGNLYIADATTYQIVKVTAAGAASVFGISGLNTALNSPGNLAVDVSGNLYIADGGNNRIIEVTPGGAGSVLNITGLSQGLNRPLGVSVDGLGSIYIADYFNNRIVTVAPGGAGAVLSMGSLSLVHPRGVAVDVSGTVYIADTGDAGIVEVMASVVNFGHAQVRALSTLTLPFTVPSGISIGNVAALTLGAPNLDFVWSEASCTGTSCTVNMAFLPTVPGLRRGAVTLYDQNQNPLITVPLHGTGDAPLATLSPGTASVINTGGVGTLDPFQIALDGAGNMYVGNHTGGNVVKVAAGGGSASVVNTGGVTLTDVTGVVLDGAGNLYIADHAGSRIVKVTEAGVASVLNITGLSPGLNQPLELAIDGAGDLYIADSLNNRIVIVTPTGAGSVLLTGSYMLGVQGVTGVAVDAAGTVYIADRTNNNVVKVTAAGVESLVVPAGVTPVLSGPQGVNVDGMGNLYIGDSGNNRIIEVTTAGVASVVQTPGLTLGNAWGVTVDPSGNVLIPDWNNNRLVKVNATGSSLTFPNTYVGSASSPQTATATNIGNQPLIFAASPAYTANFSENTGDTNLCAVSTSLLSGTVCDVSVEFTPQSAANLSASIVVTNNNLNVSHATQSVAVSGTGLVSGDTTAVAVSTNPTMANIGQPLTVTATVTDTAAGHTAIVPTGGVTFMDTVGSTVVSLNGGNPVALSGGTAVLTGVTLSGAGSHTITANYVGVTNTFLASSNTTALIVTPDAATISGPATQPVQVTNGQAGSVPVTVTGPYSVVAPPTGSVSYNVLNQSNTSVASGSATLTAGSTNSTATVPIASTLAAGSYTVSVTYGGDSNYAASAAATIIQVVVSQISPTISWTEPAAIIYGVTLSGVLNASAVNGSTPVAGTFVYTATPQGGSASAVTGATVLGAGSYTLTATFTPTDTTTYASASGSVSLSVAKAAPADALISSATAVLVTNAVTFTATVSSSVSTPSGSVSFYEGTTLLGSAVALAQGVATYTTSSLAVGSHSITAVYSGDSNFSTLSSSAVTETVADFTLSIPSGSSTSATVSPGGTASYALTITPSNGSTFPSAVTLAVSGLPTGATATITPQTLVAGAVATNVSLTIKVPSQSASLRHRDLRHNDLLALKLSPVMLGMLLPPFGGTIRRAAGKRGRTLRLLLLLLAGTSLLGITGCGEGPSSQQSQTYTVTMTATSGTLSHSTILMLTVR
jgi:sugar lactone lactonase YvrE